MYIYISAHLFHSELSSLVPVECVFVGRGVRYVNPYWQFAVVPPPGEVSAVCLLVCHILFRRHRLVFPSRLSSHCPDIRNGLNKKTIDDLFPGGDQTSPFFDSPYVTVSNTRYLNRHQDRSENNYTRNTRVSSWMSFWSDNIENTPLIITDVERFIRVGRGRARV